MLTITPETIPAELKPLPRWVVAKSETVKGRKTKVPYCPHEPTKKASSTDPATWSDFETALRLVESGAFPMLGFQLDGSGYFGVDFDHCVDENGALATWTEEYIRGLNSYTERSVSGTGAHVIGKGSLPPGGRRTGNKGTRGTVPEGSEIEMYDSGRYLVFTGHALTLPIIHERTTEIAAIHADLFGKAPAVPEERPRTVAEISDEDLLKKIRASKQGEKFGKLWDGDTSAQKGDDSAADLALCMMLAFWTAKDAARMDRLFRRSGLLRQKWERDDYSKRTIEKACALTKEVFEPSSLILDPEDPLKTAREFVKRFTLEGVQTLHHQSGTFFLFNPDTSAYVEREEATVRAEMYAFLEKAKRWDVDREKLEPFKPTKHKVEGVLDALRAICNLSAREFAPPCWIGPHEADSLNARDFLPCRNGLLHIPTRTIYPATPAFFSLNGLSYAFDPWAPEPVEWIKFLRSVWPEDQESIDTLQEIFGLSLTPDTQFQKIFLIVGATRSGKGTIARVLRKMIGEPSVCTPTLSSFGREFGREGLIGKSVAIISDARISGRTDPATVAESMLAISGEDNPSIPRKFKADWDGGIYVRFLLLSNELPKIAESSGALVGRFVVLLTKESFLGREDLGLSARLLKELPQILTWSLVGRDRLFERMYFVQPKSAEPTLEDFRDLLSPISAFLREACDKGGEVAHKDLFSAWLSWCEENGHKYPGTTQTFGRDLRAAVPSIEDARPRTDDGSRERVWLGLRLKEAAPSTPIQRVGRLYEKPPF